MVYVNTTYKLFGVKRAVLWVLGTACDVATAPSPATSGLSLVVGAGQGADFLGASTALPHKLYVTGEVVTVTGRATDTLTIVRARDGTTAQAIVTGTANAQHLVPIVIPKTNVFDINTNIQTIEFTGDGDVERVYESNGINGTLGTSKFNTDMLKWVAGITPVIAALYSDETVRYLNELGAYPNVQIDLDYKAINETTNVRTRVRVTVWNATLQKPFAPGNAANNAAQGSTINWSANSTLIDLFGRTIAGTASEAIHFSMAELVAS